MVPVGDGAAAEVPLADETLVGLRLGGSWSYGFGDTSLAETQVIDLDGLDYTVLQGADGYRIELLSPYVLRSEHPGDCLRTYAYLTLGHGENRRE